MRGDTAQSLLHVPQRMVDVDHVRQDVVRQPQRYKANVTDASVLSQVVIVEISWRGELDEAAVRRHVEQVRHRRAVSADEHVGRAGQRDLCRDRQLGHVVNGESATMLNIVIAIAEVAEFTLELQMVGHLAHRRERLLVLLAPVGLAVEQHHVRHLARVW